MENRQVVQNGFFPDNWDVIKVMEEVAYARSKISYTDHIIRNNFKQTLSNGQEVMFYIGSGTYTPSPTNPLPNFTVSVFPIF